MASTNYCPPRKKMETHRERNIPLLLLRFICLKKMQKRYFVCIVFALALVYIFRYSHTDFFKVNEQRSNLSDLITEREVKQYCSPSYSKSDRLMYSVLAPVSKLRLHAVAIVMRHGDRSPINQRRTYFDNLDLKLCRTSNPDLITSVTSLKQALSKQVPPALKNFSWYPDSHTCASAQLTGKGAEQLFKLGSKFRSRYKTLLQHVLNSAKKRLSREAEPSHIKGKGGFIYLRSTEYDRTFQSGMAFLAGLLANDSSSTAESPVLLNWKLFYGELWEEDFLNESVTISSTPSIWQCTTEMYTDKGMESPPCFCQRAERLSKNRVPRKYLLKEMEVILKAKEVATKFYGSSSSMGSAAEGVASYICNGIYLPCFQTISTDGSQIKQPTCMTWSDVGALLSAIKVVNAADSDDYNFILLEKLQIYPFLWELWYKLSQSTLYEKKEDDAKPTILIYPSHDSTIIPLLEILGVERNLWWPAFSSSLVIELHSALSKQFYIRVLYDDVDVTRKLSFCKSRFTNVDGLCLFDNFTFFVLREMQSSFGFETYSEFCEH